MNISRQLGRAILSLNSIAKALEGKEKNAINNLSATLLCFRGELSQEECKMLESVLDTASGLIEDVNVHNVINQVREDINNEHQ